MSMRSPKFIYLLYCVRMYLLEHLHECQGYGYIQRFARGFLSMLERNGRMRLIPSRDGTGTWMKRYYLMFKGSSVTAESWYKKLVPLNIMLHHVVESDEEDLHNHPWPFFVFILKGGYWEYTPRGKFLREPGYWGIRLPSHFHRIELVNEKEGSWSLFIRGLKVRDWGFRVDNEVIPHKEYLKEKYEKSPLSEQLVAEG